MRAEVKVTFHNDAPPIYEESCHFVVAGGRAWLDTTSYPWSDIKLMMVVPEKEEVGR